MSKLAIVKNNDGNFIATFKSPISIDNGITNSFQGEFESTMELFVSENEPTMIEWDIPDMLMTEHIGIEYNDGKVTGYDGVYELPKQAIQLLEDSGFVVDEFLKDL